MMAIKAGFDWPGTKTEVCSFVKIVTENPSNAILRFKIIVIS